MRAALALTVFGAMKKQSPPLYWLMYCSISPARPRLGGGGSAACFDGAGEGTGGRAFCPDGAAGVGAGAGDAAPPGARTGGAAGSFAVSGGAFRVGVAFVAPGRGRRA